MLLALILSELHEKWESKKRRLSYRNKYIEEFLWGKSLFLAARRPSYVIFCLFFCLLFPFSLLRFYMEKFFCSSRTVYFLVLLSFEKYLIWILAFAIRSSLHTSSRGEETVCCVQRYNWYYFMTNGIQSEHMV